MAFLPLVIIMGIFYVLLILPAQRRQKKTQEMINALKNGDKVVLSVLRHVFFMILKLLHPFMPFVTEEIYQKIPGSNETPLIIAPWPGKTI